MNTRNRSAGTCNDNDNDYDSDNDDDNSIVVQSIFIAPYSPKGGIGLVTIKVFITTTNYIKYEQKQHKDTAYTISIIIIL